MSSVEVGAGVANASATPSVGDGSAVDEGATVEAADASTVMGGSDGLGAPASTVRNSNAASARMATRSARTARCIIHETVAARSQARPDATTSQPSPEGAWSRVRPGAETRYRAASRPCVNGGAEDGGQ